ncbi:MAG: HEPN domain-containing protein [Nanoarchaeota archaeon]
MVSLDLKRAKDLLRSSEGLLEREDLAGVAGLAYQALESGIVALTKSKKEKDKPEHVYRRKKIEELINISQKIIQKIWEARNIDFYGNVRFGEEAKELTREEAGEALNTVKEIIQKRVNLQTHSFTNSNH